MVISAADELRDLTRRSHDTVRWLVDDLTEEAAFWEPVPGCWSVRRREDATAGWGTGAWVCEDDWPPPDPVPITTIAWRLAHLAAWTDIYRDWTFGEATLGLLDLDVPGTAQGLVAWLRRSHDTFAACLEVLDDDDIALRRPVHHGPMLTISYLARSMAVENIHHGAEIGVLLDIHRGHARVQPPPVRGE